MSGWLGAGALENPGCGVFATIKFQSHQRHMRYNVALLQASQGHTMLTVEVRSRIEPALKDEATAVLKASGLDVSTAIRLFMRSVVEKGYFPIDMPKPNARTLAAIADAKKGRTTRTKLDAL